MPAAAYSCKPSFEQQRATVVDYLRAYNDVISDLNDTAFKNPTSKNPTSHIAEPGLLYPISSIYAGNILYTNSALAQLLIAFQGGLQRTSELSAPNDEAAAHLQAIKKYLQGMITAIQNLRAAISSGNQATTSKAYDGLIAASDQASPMNRLTESLMVKYNITDSEVNYRFRGE